MMINTATAATPNTHKMRRCVLLAPQANSMINVMIMMQSTMERFGCKMMGMHITAEITNAGMTPPVQVDSRSLFFAK